MLIFKKCLLLPVRIIFIWLWGTRNCPRVLSQKMPYWLNSSHGDSFRKWHCLLSSQQGK